MKLFEIIDVGLVLMILNG